MTGFDTYQDTTDRAQQLANDGYRWVARYYFLRSVLKDPLTRSEVQALAAVGISVVTVWENGSPTSPGYFTASRGSLDGHGSVAAAAATGQPTGTPIYIAVDYDSDPIDVIAYFRALTPIVVAAGYKVGAYGNGVTLLKLLDLDLISYSWLSQSREFQGYAEFSDRANIDQGPAEHIEGLDSDIDATLSGDFGQWSVTTAAGQTVTISDGTSVSTGSDVDEDYVQAGCRGELIVLLQRCLNDLGAGLDVDGSYGPLTLRAVLKFKDTYPTPIPGGSNVGPVTWTALANMIGIDRFKALGGSVK